MQRVEAVQRSTSDSFAITDLHYLVVDCDLSNIKPMIKTIDEDLREMEMMLVSVIEQQHCYYFRTECEQIIRSFYGGKKRGIMVLVDSVTTAFMVLDYLIGMEFASLSMCSITALQYHDLLGTKIMEVTF